MSVLRSKVEMRTEKKISCGRSAGEVFWTAAFICRAAITLATMRAALLLTICAAVAAAADDDYVRGCPGYVLKSFRMLG